MSDKNMNDLLARLNTEFEPDRRQSNRSKSSPPAPASQKSLAQRLDELSADIEAERIRPHYQSRQPTTDRVEKTSVMDAARKRDRLNALIDTDYRRQAHKREQERAEIKRQAEAKLAAQQRQAAAEQAEAQRRQQELIELQQREELRAKRRKAALKEEAKKWLTKLNPKSEEGRWFEEFAYGYENRLQAAIDYLEAMRETGL